MSIIHTPDKTQVPEFIIRNTDGGWRVFTIDGAGHEHGYGPEAWSTAERAIDSVRAYLRPGNLVVVYHGARAERLVVGLISTR